MFPPVPAPFTGSLPQDLAEDMRLPHLIDRCFAAITLAAGAGAAIVAATLGHAAWPMSLASGCLAMLPPALLGLWTTRRAGALSGLAVPLLYQRVVDYIGASGRGQAVAAAADNPVDSFAGLVATTVRDLDGSRAAHARTRHSARLAGAALQAGRDQASRLAAHLRGDGVAMANAASGLMAASTRLANEAAQTSDGAAATEDSVARVAEQAISLAGSVRNVTVHITRMTEIAVNSAEAATGAQARIAGLDTSARALEQTMAQVGRALQMAGACGRQASLQAAAGEPVAADLAANLREMAVCADRALAAMLAVVVGLRTETASADRRIAELSALIQSQFELGITLSDAVGQQGEDVARVLGLLAEAHSGFAAVRAGVDAMGVRNNAQLASAEALRGSIARLPAHADTIAGILRGIPDFTPTLEF